MILADSFDSYKFNVQLLYAKSRLNVNSVQVILRKSILT